jgi:hypothetical protein
MMGVLYDGNPKALGKQIGNDTSQQRRLAGAAPPGEANHFHLVLRTDNGLSK